VARRRVARSACRDQRLGPAVRLGRFPAEVERLLARHGLPADAIELELTENMLQTGAITVHTLRELRELGIATALDDFGTGYSSLTSLEQLPLSRVKLDRSVLAEVDGNPRGAAIASSIIALCRSLGLQVTVEGVERAGQLGFLAGCGDVNVQGFLVARPVGAEEVIDIAGSMRDRMTVLLEAAVGDPGIPAQSGRGGAPEVTEPRRVPPTPAPHHASGPGAVCSPSRITATPLTSTCSTPTAYCRGSSKVARSAMVAGRTPRCRRSSRDRCSRGFRASSSRRAGA